MPVSTDSLMVPVTTDGSVAHRLLRFDERIVPRFVAYVLCALLPWGLMALTVVLGGEPWAHRTSAVSLPFWHDWNILFTFMVSVPSLFLLLASDQHMLARALQGVHRTGAVSLGAAGAQQWATDWRQRFERINRLTQRIAMAAALPLSLGTWGIYRWLHAGFWATPADGQFPLAAYAYIASIALLYWLIFVYVTRCIFLSRLLADLVRQAQVNIVPMHPDGCGGLQPVGRLGLRNQYTLSILGLNIVVLAAVSYGTFGRAVLEAIVAPAVVIYLVLGPLVFIAPMLPFRDRMREARLARMNEVADLTRLEFDRLQQLATQGVRATAAELEVLLKLKDVGEAVRTLPVWPFDPRTMRSFATAYLAPLVVPAVSQLALMVMTALGWKP